MFRYVLAKLFFFEYCADEAFIYSKSYKHHCGDTFVFVYKMQNYISDPLSLFKIKTVFSQVPLSFKMLRMLAFF